MERLRLGIVDSLEVSLDLDSERNSLLAAMFLWCELGRDAIHFDVDADFLHRIPQDFGRVEQSCLVDVHQAVGQRNVDVQDALAGSARLPDVHLLAFHVLQAALVEANLDDAFHHLPATSRQIAELLKLDLVALTLVEIRQRVLVALCSD